MANKDNDLSYILKQGSGEKKKFLEIPKIHEELTCGINL